MDTIFTLGDNDNDDKLNIDDLYERKKQHDLNTLSIYNKILNRVRNKIKTVSRHQVKEQFCWYVIPEMIIGVPKYDHGGCTAYIIDRLNNDGFLVRYTHPNLLFISWQQWVPSYVRTEIKKKTGVIVDGYGNEVDNSKSDNVIDSDDTSSAFMLKRNNNIPIANSAHKDYKSIDGYKPTGNLIYNQDLLKNIEDKSKN